MHRWPRDPGEDLNFPKTIVRVELQKSPKTTQRKKQRKQDTSTGHTVNKGFGGTVSGSGHLPETETAIENKPEERKERNEPEVVAHQLSSHQVDLVHIHRFFVAEQSNDNAQTNSRLCCGHGDDKNSENLARGILKPVGKSNQVQVDRVEHQFNRHQNDDDISAGENPHHSNRKNDGTENQIMCYIHHIKAASASIRLPRSWPPATIRKRFQKEEDRCCTAGHPPSPYFQSENPDSKIADRWCRH